jgi:hypothetical protein
MVASQVSDALGRMTEWVLADPECSHVGIVTFRSIANAIRLVVDPDDGVAWAKWVESGQTVPDVATVQLAIEPLIERKIKISVGHFGAVRGLNSMADADAVITIGDPWLDVGVAQSEALYLGVEWNERLEALSRAELEQAHGRLRTIHRARPGRALHVGNMVPSGSHWARDVDVVRMPAPRPLGLTSEETIGVVRDLGGPEELQRVIGCGRATAVRVALGFRSLSPAAIALIRAPAA